MEPYSNSTERANAKNIVVLEQGVFTRSYDRNVCADMLVWRSHHCLIELAAAVLGGSASRPTGPIAILGGDRLGDSCRRADHGRPIRCNSTRSGCPHVAVRILANGADNRAASCGRSRALFFSGWA